MSSLTESDIKQVVGRAKNWLSDVLADEHPTNIGLDEIEFDSQAGQWRITLGFSRPWNTSTSNALTTITGLQAAKRAYRVLTLDGKTGEVISMKRRSSDGD
ncbi:hypothetical protein ACQR16_32720 [Bradyrhizobium oligotrophicum]|uniref:hypothetical protein n=1 Tax=Bradyrhizobium oligotrophicum TaxID=44255 RepID=UPI003EBE5D7B